MLRTGMMVLRAGAALVLLPALATALLSPATSWPLRVLAVAALAGGLVAPALMLPFVLAVLPWGERLAAVPVRAAELVAWSFVAGWVCRVWEMPALDRHARRTAWPAAVFALVVIASWMRLVWQRTPPIGELAHTLQLLRLFPVDYLVTAGRAPHTAVALQWVLAASLFTLVLLLGHREPRVPARVLCAVAAAGLATAIVSVLAVPAIYVTTGDWKEIDRYISVTRSRGAFHLRDVNAAGSLYVLAGLLSCAWRPRARAARAAWRVVQAAVLVALWMSGSRTALAIGSVAVAVWAGAQWWMTRGGVLPRVPARALGAAAVALLVLMTASVWAGSPTATTGSASLSLSIRGEFLQTSLGMIATAPLTGVGIGTYYERSHEFMPDGIRAIYGRENAHNYFMQIWAELGLVGLCAFLWWTGAALGRGWHAVPRDRALGLAGAAVCGTAAYLLTAVTGHPFLVPEAALPFWAALAATTLVPASDPAPDARRT